MVGIGACFGFSRTRFRRVRNVTAKKKRIRRLKRVESKHYEREKEVEEKEKEKEEKRPNGNRREEE